MSTRSCIAKANKGDGWEGVYCHCNGYPTEQGAELWKDLHETFGGDVARFLHERLDKHSAGYSSFPDICYCHGWPEKDQREMVITSKHDYSTEPLSIEWVYVFSPSVLTIYVGTPTAEERVYRWLLVSQVELQGREPDWEEIERLGDKMSEEAWKTLRPLPAN